MFYVLCPLCTSYFSNHIASECGQHFIVLVSMLNSQMGLLCGSGVEVGSAVYCIYPFTVGFVVSLFFVFSDAKKTFIFLLLGDILIIKHGVKTKILHYMYSITRSPCSTECP